MEKSIKQTQFRLSSLLWSVTLICAAFALVVQSNWFVQTVAWSVIGANILGAIAAMFVTHGLGMPRDGSYRHGCEDGHDEVARADSDLGKVD